MATTTPRSHSKGTPVRLTPPTRFDYRPGLDGVRALAVVAVLLYHVDVTWIPGGFLGVETFFVLSGYLITALLLAETTEHGTVSLKGFWARRGRRLLPAAYALLAGVVGVAAVFGDELARVIDELPAALLYVYNWLPIVTEESYFEFMGRPSPLRHLWSLAIEEQFYLVWPLVLVWAMRSGGRRRLGYVALGGAVLSGVVMVLMAEPGIDPSRVYYGTDTRAAGLLIGALGAIIWHPSRRVGRRHRRALSVAGTVGVAGLVAAFLTVSEYGSFLYGGGFALISIASLFLTLAAADDGGPLARLLGVAPLRWLGTRSYAIYLWHWPVVVFTRPGIDVPFDGVTVMAFRVVVSLLLADISYRLIETRFRTRGVAVGPSPRSPLPAPVGFPRRALAGLAMILLVTSVSAVGWDGPTDGPTADVALAAEDLPTSAVTSETSDAPRSTTTPGPGTVLTTVPVALGGDTSTTTTTTVAASTSTPAPTSPPSTRPDEEKSNKNDGGSKDKASTSTTAPAKTSETAGGTAARPDLDSASFSPPTTKPPPPPPSVTAIGDSVMAGAVGQLEKVYDGPIEVDAEVGRSFEAGVDVLQAKADDGSLGDVVVIHLGNNGLVDPNQVKRLVEMAGKKRPVIFVNVRVPRRWQELVNSALADSVPPHANATLVDWYAHSEGKHKWFNADGLHIVDTPGAPAYAKLIVGAVEAATP